MEQRIIKFRCWSKVNKIMDYDTGYRVDKDLYELMQFTGLLDKSGKEIYEGDIFPSNSEGIKFYKLVFENGGFVLYHNYGYWGTIARFIEASEKFNFNLEIIGNIYENPELLKNKL